MKAETPKILIVDDNPKNIQVLAGFLTENGYELEYSLSGIQALQWIDKENFDIILLDIMMPEMDGFEVCQKIKSNPKNKDLPVIFLTARTDIESIKKSFEIGGVDYLSKPFNGEELLARVATHIELKQSKDRLKVMNEKLNELVKERTIELEHTIAALKIEKEKAEKSDRLKTAFMNNISHEVRTPLNGILGFGDFMMDPNLSQSEKQEYWEILNRSSTRLMNTITSYMDISLIVSGNLEISKKPVDIPLVFQAIQADFHKACLDKSLEFNIKIPENPEQIALISDAELMVKALSYLVDNAIKFTEKGVIQVGLETINDTIGFYVKDTGKGIAEESKEIVFKQFMQEDISNTRAHEGSGLGLSIAKGIIQLLGGTIRLESKKGEGTSVFITFNVN